MSEEDLIHSEITRQIIGAAFEVHRVLGPGFLESVYEKAMAYELRSRQLDVHAQVEVPIYYKGVEIATHIPDLVVEGKVIVELKAAKDLADAHVSTVMSYLKATRLQVALLINFGKPSVQYKRIVR